MDIPVLIEPKALAALRDDHPVVLLDTRDPEAYAAEHIPGAVNLREIFTYLIEDSRPETMQTLQQRFADALGAAGLSGREVAVVYEDALDSGYGQSCRGYFLLAYLGYPKISILHGGYQAWKNAGLPVTDELPQPAPQSFPLASDDSLLVSKEQMLSALDDPAIVKLDVRDYDEWEGSSSSPYGVDFCPRKGRIPGAVWVEWYRVMDRSGSVPRFRSPEEIRKACSEVGVSPEQTVYIYCFKGSRAANVLVALKQAGFRDVRNYFASWNEWSRDPKLPIETGAPDPARMAARS
ncbi:sulfurtransferase [Haliangium sp.]|uniref:sulfurtransferase n=1 Tax=Haliangium sp. TaxID=2663208 RepID=UPI003D1510B5